MSLPLDAAPPTPLTFHATRPFYWSVRREIWENRSVYLAPAIVAGVVLFAYLVAFSHGALGSPQIFIDQASNGHHTHASGKLNAPILAALPFEIMAAILCGTGAIVGMFYCLSALFNERKDRSILFWKSLPVSNLTSVLAKAAVPMLVVPAVVFVITSVAELITLVLCLIGAAAHHVDASLILDAQPFGRGSIVLAYLVAAVALWYAPIYAWLLLVSAWAKTMTFLWAVAPPIVLSIFERIAFGSDHVGQLIKYRLFGLGAVGFSNSPGFRHIDLDNLDPVGFVTAPGLWLGLIAAALMLAGVVWLRRRKEPL
jgi:ABC-2 type transport system permease protein